MSIIWNDDTTKVPTDKLLVIAQELGGELFYTCGFFGRIDKAKGEPIAWSEINMPSGYKLNGFHPVNKYPFANIYSS